MNAMSTQDVVTTGQAAALAHARWRAPSREARDTLFMVALIGWTILPHLVHLPLWVSGLSAAVLGWRGWLAWRQSALPGRAAVLELLSDELYLTDRLNGAIAARTQALELRRELGDVVAVGTGHRALSLFEWYAAER